MMRMDKGQLYLDAGKKTIHLLYSTGPRLPCSTALAPDYPVLSGSPEILTKDRES